MTINSKHIAYGIIFVLLAAVTFQSYKLSIKIDQLNAANSNINTINELLNHKQDSINKLSKETAVLQLKADSLGKVVLELKKDNTELSNQLDSTLSSIDNIPPEKNYRFLQDSAYRYYGKLEYPFNAKQVTEIRKTYTENIMIKKINVNLATTVNILQRQVNVQDSIIGIQYVQLDMYSGMVKTLRMTLDLKHQENLDLYKDVINQKRLKYLFEGATLVGVIYILISLI